MRPVLLKAAIALAAIIVAAMPASAALLITIDKVSQRMTVAVDGVEKYRWPVSTGAFGYATPSGSFTPFRMEKDYFSKEWDDAPMPYAIFFTGRGHAIHGTGYTKRLGTRASHGCVRLSVANAATLFALVKREGMKNTKVVVGGGFDLGNVPVRLPSLFKSDKSSKPAKAPPKSDKIELAPGLKKLFGIQ
ncbi:MAG TPA: L,D-transpeptidase [Bauldia sp.]|nr:L,D-transpeptidase [Bauldia sp.]